MIRRVIASTLTALCISGMTGTSVFALELEDLSQTFAKQTLSTGRFVQERELAGFPKPMRTEGVYYLNLKKGIVWVTKKPFAHTMIFSDAGIRTQSEYSDSSLSSRDIPYLKTVNELMLAILGADTGRLSRDFEVKLTGSPDHWTMTLVTRKDSSLNVAFSSMTVSGSDMPKVIEMTSRQNETTRLTLSSQKALKTWPKGIDPL